MVLSNVQIYDLARSAGFPPDVAVQMVAIALRESGGNQNAANLTPPDESYGLWQINVYDRPAGYKAAIMAQVGVSDPRQLLDPATNARAAFRLWGGNPNNLNIAWSINKFGPPYFLAEKYLANLVPAQLARAQSTFDAGTPAIVAAAPAPTGGGSPTAVGDPPGAAAGFPLGLAIQPPPTRPAPAGGISSRILPRWFTSWWAGSFSRKLPAEAGLVEALQALIAIYGRSVVFSALLSMPDSSSSIRAGDASGHTT